MALVWRYGQAFTARDEDDPTGAPVCTDPNGAGTFDLNERWQELTWSFDGRFDGRIHIIGEARGRHVVGIYLHPAEFTNEHAKLIVEAVRKVLTPLPAFSGQARRHQWVELPDSMPLDRCTGGHHVWPKGAYKDEDFCYCGKRHLREARRGA